MGPDTALLAATALHAGFQAVVTVVVYPALSEVRAEAWSTAHSAHSRRITYLVAPLYAVVAAACVWALLTRPWSAGTVLALVGNAVAAGLTAASAAPTHGRLGREGRQDPLVRRLLVVDRLRLAAVAVALAGAVAASSGGSDALAAELEETGLALYLPELAGRLPGGVVDEVEPGVEDKTPATEPARSGAAERSRPAAVEVTSGVVVVSYVSGGRRTYTLHQQPAPRGSLCDAVAQSAGSECTESGGVLRSTMEETAMVAVTRGETLLVLRGLVREANPGIVEAAVTVLQEAPVVSPEQLAGG